jgi:5S rRNA maturation endonuclease (ribonuclease M5)
VAPFEHVLSVLDSRGLRVQRKAADKARSTCPGHRDKRPSLSLQWTGDRVLVRCHAGCNTRELLRAVGLTMADLFAAAPAPTPPPKIVATYRYTDEAGRPIAEKVRFCPKAFAWRAFSEATEKPRWGLDGVPTPLTLYRLHELQGASQVVVVEGEKAVDRLRAIGITATCPHAGASSWPERFTAALAQAGALDIVVLPDADRAGIKHAERIAASVCAHSGVALMNTKIVNLPNLPPQGDVVDWLDGGGDASELQRLVQEAPAWFPGAAQRERAERRRNLNAERQRRFRERRRRERLRATA